MIHEVADAGACAIVITSEVEEMFALADRILVLRTAHLLVRCTAATSINKNCLRHHEDNVMRPQTKNGFYIAFALLVLATVTYSPAFSPYLTLMLFYPVQPRCCFWRPVDIGNYDWRIDTVGSTMFLSGGVFVVLQEQGMPMVLAFLAVMVLEPYLGRLMGC